MQVRQIKLYDLVLPMQSTKNRYLAFNPTPNRVYLLDVNTLDLTSCSPQWIEQSRAVDLMPKDPHFLMRFLENLEIAELTMKRNNWKKPYKLIGKLIDHIFMRAAY